MSEIYSSNDVLSRLLTLNVERMLKPSFATSNALIKPILMGTDAKTVVYTHVNGDIQLLADIPTRQRLRSSTSDDLCVPAVRLPTVGRRAFSVAGARVWKALPVDVTSAPSLFTFRKRLKLHLFSLSYPGQVY